MQNSITTKPNKVNHEISRLKGATATAVSGGGGGGFNEYKYNLSFQNLIQLKSIERDFFCHSTQFVSGCRAKFGYQGTELPPLDKPLLYQFHGTSFKRFG